MRYQTVNKYRKYVQGHGFLSFARKFVTKYGKKLMDTAVNTKGKYGKQLLDTTKKQGTNFVKTAGKKIIDKSVIATGDLIGTKIADKITSLGNKQKNDEKENENVKKQEEIIFPPEKRQQIINDLRLF